VNRIHFHAANPVSKANELLGSPVGQIVGRMNAIRPAAEIVEEIAAEFQRTLDRLK
jgi:hypothetical protein